MAYYQQNMLSIKSRALLANILAEVLLLSDSLEAYREALARVDYFDCIALFRYLDLEEKGYLREKDFQRAIGTSHRKLLTYAFSWFDSMKVGEISRLQFAAFLLPKDDLNLRELVAKRVENPQLQEMQQSTILTQFSIFSKLLVQIMNREMRIIELRRELIKNNDYSIRAVLSAMDVHGHQWLCADDFLNFLKNYGFDANLRQIQKLVEVINCSFDGQITEEQLRWTIEGFQNKNKAYLTKIKDSNKKQHLRPSSQTKEQISFAAPLTNEFTVEEAIPSASVEKFKQLIEECKLSEQQQKTLDELLKAEEKEVGASIDKECQRFVKELKERRMAQLQEKSLAIEREILARRMLEERKQQCRVQRQMEQQALAQMRTSKELQYLEELSRVNNYLKTIEDAELSTKYRLPPQGYTPSPSRNKYDNLTRLSRLTQVQSYRKTSERSYIPPLLQDNSPYFSQVNYLRQVIKKQRQIQKQIQNKFASGKFDTSRFSSRGSPPQKINQVSASSQPQFNKQYSVKKQQSPNKQAFMSTQANKFILTTDRNH